MKKAVVLVFMAVFGAAANADLLMRFTKGATFGPTIVDTKIEVQTDGKVISYLKNYQTGKTTIRHVARLSEVALEALNNKIHYVDASKGIEDLQPGQDPCSDDPEVNIDVWKNGLETRIFKTSACHDFKLKNGSADTLIELGRAFYLLQQ